MANNWRQCSLGDVIELKRGYDLPTADRRAGSIPIISSSGPSGWHDEAKAKAPGVVTGRYGTIGQVFFIEQDFWPLNTTLYVRDFKGNDERFVSYFLRSLDFQSFNDKSSVPGLNRNDLHRAPVRFPPVGEQVEIAATLGSLDDKIEQNRRTGRKLEALARAVFKAWFVDFEPVTAKAAGATAFPGMPPETFAALPNTLQDSPLGRVPQGWKIKSLSECISHLLDHRGKTPKKLGGDWASVGGTPALSAKNVKAGRIIRSELNNFVDEEMFRRWMPEPLELNDIVMTSEAPLGELTYLARHADYCLSQRVFGIRADPDVIKPSVLYRFLESDGGQSQVVNRATGTTVVGIRQSELRKLEVAVAPIPIQRAASAILQPIAEQLAQLEETSEKLAVLRDYLLPRLLSGRVRVPNAARIMEVVA